MEQPIKNNSIAQKVMDKIKSDKIKIKPKLYFVFRTAVYFSLVALCFCLAIFLASFLVFAAKINQFSFLLLFLLFWALLLMVGGTFLAKKFSFFYKKPLAISLIIFIAATLISSALVLRTTLHNELLERSQKNNWPIISPLYHSGCGCQDDCGCGAGNTCPLLKKTLK
ncbi:hypothetical protein COX74_02370 [bacterium (Candidatus Gribaldobacteria) CG_4_10_14_0_2_um_filter_41_16]|uniref:Uncharacterized protein n=3 Tax=Candidatus Gribaldobacteria TaxID=2798536 RepID=A0A2M7VI38_9BACT|nr:MAG: hypothetical protein AUJ36_02800 [Parcubacteria group bacterium CG1_02_41_26]PIV47254.1 MAG: hypothetical protein COS21_00950 [bacterium (Candidatus Gribaldobacteria) CG02_land_8_20_14_3_00_41_15]PIX03267.1 MAG: hypothetical protein COZ78_01290 [bacterium (Candidatus Gribaldobacteria) CG_4_8_14_3_um_filter_42_11]PJA01504.1 MAG: hypothetical protein COX74_02370 [bacterium (Candidatus Gribaldobacteria) CG_4_10_14_0_2_um_filter_41_16]